jgi:WD40 repeat protein
MKAKIRIMLSVILLMAGDGTMGQHQNKIWYFGYEAGIDFTGGTPVALTNGVLNSIDYSSVLCDSSGNVLLYTNGEFVYNSNHQVMANGTGLMGSSNGGQVCVIVPQPGSNLIYIFTVGQFASTNGFRYNIVDMNLQGGLGEVVVKNALLFSPSTERVAAVYNATGNFYWIITHAWNNNHFLAYKLSSTGLNPTPVISAVGSIHAGGALGYYNSLGQLAISPDGSKIACAIYSLNLIECFQFDLNTGVLSSPIGIGGFTNAWGTAFSPNSTKLYVTSWYSTNLFQLSVDAWDTVSIASSVMLVGNALGPNSTGRQIGYLQLAPDRKIYAAVLDDSYLGVVNYPDLTGLACGFVDNGLYLNGKISSAGLCNTFVNTQLFSSAPEHPSSAYTQIFYNPELNKIYVNATDQLINQIRLYDLNGKLLVNQYPLSCFGFIDVEKFNSGIYLTEIVLSKNTLKKKIALLR